MATAGEEITLAPVLYFHSTAPVRAFRLWIPLYPGGRRKWPTLLRVGVASPAQREVSAPWNVWVDADTYLPRRFEGELAKNPSWWVQDVRVVFIYGNVGGMWLQTASEASGNVRILGRSTRVSRDVRYKLNEVVIIASASLDGSSRLPLVIGPISNWMGNFGAPRQFEYRK